MNRARNRQGQPVLTAREWAFIDAYMRNPNALQATVKAGYRSPQKASFQLLRRPHVIAEIERRQRIAQQSVNFDIKALLDWSVFGATHDLGEILKPGTFEILAPDQWPDPRKRSLVESYERTTTTSTEGVVRVSTKIKFTPRNSHFDRIANLMGVPKKVDLKLAHTRSIPMEVIDMITRRLDDEEEARPKAQPASVKPR